jgi:hypothetical protein
MTFVRVALSFVLSIACLVPGVLHAAELDADGAKDDTTDLETIHVIAITPQQGASLPEMMIPYNVQSTTSGELDRTQTLSITDYMNAT